VITFSASNTVTRLSTNLTPTPLLTGRFIGGYFQVDAVQGTVLVHFNANYRSVTLLGEDSARQGRPDPAAGQLPRQG
jgi:hypothetical protein